jgi:hypothetical protein
VTTGSWRCPLCNTLADDARAHLAEVHGVGSDRDRLGQREAIRRNPPRLPGDDESEDGVRRGGDDRDADVRMPPRSPTFEPPIWRRVPPASPRGGRSTGPGTSGESLSSDPPLAWRRARRPASSRRSTSDQGDLPPARPAPLPPDAAVLRLVCETLEGVDAAVLRDRLLDLPGVESVALDLYARTADLYLDRTRATPPHLVAMARERVRLPVRAAELHRAAEKGQPLGAATLIYVVQ